MQLLNNLFFNPNNTINMKNSNVLKITLAILFGFFTTTNTQAQLTEIGNNVYLTNPSGQVGLGGITAPKRDLSVKGYVRAARDVEETEYVEIYHGGGNGFINTAGDGNLDFRHDNSTKMSLTSAGRLGIGTSTPDKELSVKGTIRASYDAAETRYTELIHGGTNAVLNFSFGNLDLRYNYTTLFTFKNNGNLGIGTTNPGYALTVDKNVTNNWQSLFSNNGTNVYLSHGGGYGMNINSNNNASNKYALRVRSQASQLFNIYNDGKIVVGPDATFAGSDVTVGGNPYLFFVRGGAKFEEVKVDEDWADYVFEEDYELTTLEEVAAHIDAKGHLHNTPSAKEIADNGGVELGEATVNQQEKIEELFLHLIQLNEDMKSMNAEMNSLKSENENLKQEITELKK